MIRKSPLVCISLLLLPLASFAADDVILNEVYYNPPENDLAEFIELYNPTSSPIDLTGYTFSTGLTYTFPADTIIQPGGYLLLVRDPTLSAWRTISSGRLERYEGKLANAGEKITLRAPDRHVVDVLDYSDNAPWPRGADGYGSSLERISPDLPSEDFHSWRGSLQQGGTPGRQNSVSGAVSRPAITSVQFLPDHPVSTEAVYVDITLDSPDLIDQVTLRIETRTHTQTGPVSTQPMSLAQQDETTGTFRATIPPHPSQTLVRVAVEVTRKDGQRVRLPDSTEPRPFESYFVYDGEIPSKMPILWIFPEQTTALPERSREISAAVVKPVTSDRVLVYDGARIERSLRDDTGRKVRFLKGEEFRGDRTINIMPEVPMGYTTAGAQSNHVEHIAFRLFRDLGVLTPRCDFYRVIELGRHAQQIAIQQPNEQFLAVHGRDDTANIYKVAYQEEETFPNGYSRRTRYTKKTNTDEGDEDLFLFSDAIHSIDPELQAQALRRFLVVDEVMAYSVAGALMSNWDGFFNNMFLVHNPPPIDRWECVPWDLDKTFGYTDTNHMFVEMPLEFPRDGEAAHAAREPGPISRPFHQDEALHAEYLRRVRAELDGLFSIERVSQIIDEEETLFLEDLTLLEQYDGSKGSRRRSEIQNSYDTIRTFLSLRHEYLRRYLPTPVEDWALY